MSWSRFITIENLCIAAEVTAAMLLLAFSFPEQRSKVKTSEKDDTNIPLLELARRAFLEEKLARSLELLAMLDSPRPPVDYTERLASEFSDAEAIGWVDRLSGTFNRAFIDAFLNRWLALPNDNRFGSYLSMISLKDYTELVRDSGPVQVELMLRDLGSRLKSQCADQAIVARLPPDQFLLITFDGDPSAGVQCVDSASEESRDPDATSDAQSKPMSLVCSVVELSDEISSFEEAVGQLETGNNTAAQLGEKFYFKQGSSWTRDIPTPSTSKRKLSPRSDDSSLPRKAAKSITPTANATGDTQSNSSETDDAAEQALQENGTAGNQDKDAPESDSLEAPIQGKSSDVSAVASNEEIAALFAQIKKHDRQSEKSQGATTVATSVDPGIANPETTLEAVRSERAIETPTTGGPQSAVKPQAASGQQSPAEPQSSVNALSATDSLSESDSVSADDIASLFATFKTAEVSKTLPTDKKSSSDQSRSADVSSQSTKKTTDSEKGGARSVDIAELESMSETASADDIGALFKAVQQERKQDKAEPAISNAVSNRRMAQEIKELSETATADDIADLFNAVQSSAAPAKKPPLATPSPSIEDLGETATTDDIAALFKAVQQESKEVKSIPLSPNPSADRQFAQEIEDISETATSDDIAELFKAVKSGLGPTKEPAEAPPAPTQEDLGETATADDIAALFASLKQGSVNKGPN
jgi:GGDEF domain-containing protein